MKTVFKLPDSLEAMAPVLLTPQRVASVLAGDEQDFTTHVRTAFDTIAVNKDVVVLEGGGSLREGWMVNLAPPHVSTLLNATELVIVPYCDDLQLADDLVTARQRLGSTLLAGIINSVPKHRLDFVRNQIVPFVKRHDIPILAVLPKERVLLSVSVEELSEGLAGQVLCAHGNLKSLVEHLMVGAMGADSALKYFRRKPNKAVITGGDRPDMQLAALETSTRCLILTGNIRPNPQILGRAEELGVPIILTAHDTMTVVERIETFFGKARFHQEEKVRHFQGLLKKHMDFERLYEGLGLRRPA